MFETAGPPRLCGGTASSREIDSQSPVLME